jgi:hypothetical protein
MKYERFKELWDALITNNPNVPPMKFEMTPTMEALIEYGRGNKTKIEFVRNFLDKKL